MVAATELAITREDVRSPVARELIDTLNAELTLQYPEPGATHFRLTPDEVDGQRGIFLVASLEGRPVACGAVRTIAAGVGEIKRMFVRPDVRGRGISRVVLSALESEARGLGLRRVVLETGIRQTAALALYRRTGYDPTPPYGEYIGSPTSVCLGKDLVMDVTPDYVALLRHSVARAEPALRAMTPAAAAARPAPGKWCPAEIIGHLIDSASNNHVRFVRAALENDLVFPGYEQDGWVRVQSYQTSKWTELVELWAGLNRHLAHVIEAVPADVRRRPRATHNLDEVAWQPVPRDTPATLDYFMSDYVAHCRHHLRQILGATWDADGSGVS